MYRLMFVLLALVSSALLCSIIPLALLESPVIAAWAAGWAIVTGLGAMCALDADTPKPMAVPLKRTDHMVKFK